MGLKFESGLWKIPNWECQDLDSQSWVRISYGTNRDRFKQNNTGHPADPHEDQKSQTSVMGLQPDQRQKQNHKRVLVDSLTIPMA